MKVNQRVKRTSRSLFYIKPIMKNNQLPNHNNDRGCGKDVEGHIRNIRPATTMDKQAKQPSSPRNSSNGNYCLTIH